MARILAARNGRVQNSPPMIKRCWAGGDDPLMLAYHDEEWGVPLHGDGDLFAKLVLDGFQAGLSWRVILHKRSEEHTSELQSQSNLVCRLLLEKKKKKINT